MVTLLDEKELAKQLNTYADGITAFAVVQGLGFCLLVGQSVSLACTVSARWYVAGPLMIVGSVVYLFLVRRCQLAEDEVSGLPAELGATVSKVVAMIRATRFWIILAIGIGETA